MDEITLELLFLGTLAIILIVICTYRVVKFYKTDTRNTTIYFLLIWLFSLATVLGGLVGTNAPFHSDEAGIIFRIADSMSIGILLSMVFFANSMLYGGVIKGRRAMLMVLYALVESVVIVTLYLTVPHTFVPDVTFNRLTYEYNIYISLAYVPIILPILYVFINMEKADPPNKTKYRLYLIGFISALVELTFDIPGTLPDLTFYWRLFALAAMILVLIALLLPKTEN
ncbi:MAG TPA: hypothetical protein VKK79_03340 [Candidatus Lokiarchaeia archaeon]|nr:hypothetical protein [Candidatus Lokiarchaeia archaeon]